MQKRDKSRQLYAPIAPLLFAMLTACGQNPSGGAPKQPAAKTEVLAHETELLKITLNPEAERRLSIATAAIGNGSSNRIRRFHAEVVIAPAAKGLPIVSITDLSVLASAQATADAALARAGAELQIAETAATRAEALVREEAGSVRIRDEALSALVVARANFHSAQTLRALYGEPISVLGRRSAYWLRVPVFASDVESIDRKAAAAVHILGSSNHGRRAWPTMAPPTANAAAGTVDLYYALDDSDGAFQRGQRVAVELPLTGVEAIGASVPASAVLVDIYGGEWVYAQTAPLTYVRHRVEVAAIKEGQALIRRGPVIGTRVVIAGAAELFGTEFGAK